MESHNLFVCFFLLNLFINLKIFRLAINDVKEVFVETGGNAR